MNYLFLFSRSEFCKNSVFKFLFIRFVCFLFCAVLCFSGIMEGVVRMGLRYGRRGRSWGVKVFFFRFGGVVRFSG